MVHFFHILNWRDEMRKFVLQIIFWIFNQKFQVLCWVCFMEIIEGLPGCFCLLFWVSFWGYLSCKNSNDFFFLIDFLEDFVWKNLLAFSISVEEFQELFITNLDSTVFSRNQLTWFDLKLHTKMLESSIFFGTILCWNESFLTWVNFGGIR